MGYTKNRTFYPSGIDWIVKINIMYKNEARWLEEGSVMSEKEQNEQNETIIFTKLTQGRMVFTNFQ